MDLEKIVADWKSDCIVDDTKLQIELFKTSHLHAKYLELLIQAKAKLSSSEKKYNRMAAIKRRYFRGELTKDELNKYGWEQYQGLKPSSSELNQLFELDSDLNDLTEQVSYFKTGVTALEYILKSIQGRDFTIKAAIDFARFLSGG